MNSIRPSKRLNDILATYFDFDHNQLKLGLWSGDLKIENVNLRKEAFDPLLNDWKDKHANIDLAAFLSKETFVDKEPSFSSLVDLELINGAIGYCRATVPWKNLLLGAGDTTVQIDLRDVTIRLRLESCMAKELQNNHGGFAGYHAKNKKPGKIGRLHGDERRWKQEMIRIAEQYHREKKDIPTPAEFEKRKSDFFSEQNATAQEDTDDETEVNQPTFLQEFVKSFASSVGWHVGNGLKASMRNIQIIMVQDGVEVGMHTDTIEIDEYFYEEDDSGIFSTADESGSLSSPMKMDGKRLRESIAISSDGSCIKKQLKISNCGVFVKKCSHNQSDAVEPVLDEYIVQPTNAKVSMCLRKTGISTVKVEEEKPHQEDHASSGDDSFFQSDAKSSVERKKPRRGKREKGRKLAEGKEDSLIGSEQQIECEGTKPISAVDNAAAVDEYSMMKKSESQLSFEGINFAESSALFSTEIRLDTVVAVPTTRSIALLSVFLTRVSHIKQGRPHGELSDFEYGSRAKMRFCKQMVYYSLLNGVLKDVMHRRALVNYFAKVGEGYHCSASSRSYRRKIITYYSEVGSSAKVRPKHLMHENVLIAKKEFLKKIEDILPVEQILLYRALAKSGNTFNGSLERRRSMHRSSSLQDFDFSLEGSILSTSGSSVSTSPERSRGHRLSKSMALSRSYSGKLRKAPKHQRRKTLNIDNMNDVLDLIPSGRQVRYAAGDLNAIEEGKSYEEGTVRANLETMCQFDSMLMNDEQFEGKTQMMASESFLDAQQTIAVSFSITFALSELKLFLCVDKSCDDFVNDSTSDDISILSTFTFDEKLDNDDGDSFERGLHIFGTNHIILLSSTLLKTRLYRFHDLGENAKVTAFSVEYAICKVKDVTVLQTGRIPSCMVHSSTNSPARALKPGSIDDLIDYNIWGESDSHLPFLRAKITKKSHDTSDLQRIIQVSVAKISVLVNSPTVKELKTATILFTKLQPLAFASRYEYDCIRYEAAKSLVQHVPKVNSLDLLIQLEGVEINFNLSVEHSTVCRTTLGRVECKQGSFLKEPMAGVGKISTEFPSTSFHNTLITYQDLQMYFGDSKMFDMPLKGEVLLSQNSEVFCSQRASQYLTIICSPIHLVVTESLVEKMALALSTFKKENRSPFRGNKVSMRSMLRLSVCAKLKKTKFQLQIRSIRIALAQANCPVDEAEGSLKNMRKIALREILVDLLSLLVCFPPPFSSTAALEGLGIARGRISSLGLSHDQVENCLVFVVDQFIRSIGAMEATARCTKEVSNSIGLSPGNYFFKNKYDQNEDSDTIVDRLINSTASEAVEHSLSLGPIGSVEWSNSLVLELSSGFVLDAESFEYDWSLSGRINSFSLRNGAGRNLVSVSTCPGPSNFGAQVLQHAPSPSGFLFAVKEHEAGYELGAGGLSLNDLSRDTLIKCHLERRGSSMHLVRSLQANIGLFDLHFSDLDFTNAIESLSLLSRSISIEDQTSSYSAVHERRSVVESMSASVDFEKCQVSLFTDELQPFAKAHLDDFSVDIVSSKFLKDQMKKLQVIARSDTIFLYDLSPEGQIFEAVIEPESVALAQDSAFEIRMTISNDTTQIPSELLILFTGIRLVILRRFLTELFQFFLNPQYGVGHFVSVHSDNLTAPSENSTSPHPFSYQVYLLESSIICPKTSKSPDLIALKSPKIVLSNSYEAESFSLPNFGVDANDTVDTESKDEINDSEDKGLFDFMFDLKSESVVYDDLDSDAMKPFDQCSVLRIHVSAEHLKLYTGLSSEVCEEGSESRDLYYLVGFLKIQDISDGATVFAPCGILPEDLFSKRQRLSRLCNRKWEEVTIEPVKELEVFADFSPSNLRILVKDQITFDGEGAGDCAPVSVKLRMSQFYALLSMWYGNMQEMPVLFPYSISTIVNAIEIPPCPSHWPEYGTSSFIERMVFGIDKKVEMFISVKVFSWHCSFDHSEYFPKSLGCAYMLEQMNDGISLEAEEFLLKVDFDTERVMRVGCASGSFLVKDHRNNSTRFEDCFIIPKKTTKLGTVLDMNWGLYRGMKDFSDNLGSPFRFTVFMTPDQNCLINVGFDGLDSCTSDLAFFWILLEYFSAYFLYCEFGNPYFEAERKRIEYFKGCNKGTNDSNANQRPCLNLDVRLWLIQPRIAIPSDALDKDCSKLMLKSQLGGISYRYRTVDYGMSSQNIFTKNMEMLFLSNPLPDYDLRKLKNADKSVQILITDLNMCVIYDMHIDTNHMNVSLSSLTPDDFHEDLEGIEPSSSQAEPIILPEPTVCNPRIRQPKKWNRQSTSDIVLCPEYLKHAVAMLSNFVGPYPEEKNVEKIPEADDKDLSFSVSAKLCNFRFVICEPVLGMHLPIANIYISQLQCSVSDFKAENNNGCDLDFQACADIQLWIDYYKSGPTRSWEPLLEPYKCTVLYDKSSKRGQGITVNSESPFHVNVSGAFLETMDFATGALFTSIFKVLDKEEQVTTPLPKNEKKADFFQGRKTEIYFTEELCGSSGEAIPIEHEKVLTLSSNERVTYSLANLSGHHIRFHQHNSNKEDLSVGYVDHLEITALSFPSTRSVFRNLKVVEVSSDAFEDEGSPANKQFDSSHFIDVQVPGMYWCHSICVDKTGKQFVGLSPRSDLLLAKLSDDWQLANAFALLTEVSTFEGGRQVSLTSPMVIVNKTCHKICLAFHIDPKCLDKLMSEWEVNSTDNDNPSNDYDVQNVHPGETHHVPISLMEAALHSEGANLGCFWMKPEEEHLKELQDFHEGNGSTKEYNSSIGYCSRPVEINKIVEESAVLFKNGTVSPEELNTQYHLFCPIITKNDGSVSPFCYCVEVKRSPIVSPFPGHGAVTQVYDDAKRSKTSRNVPIDLDISQFVSDIPSLPLSSKKASSPRKNNGHDPNSCRHGPVAYSLIIHPPIVIENLLPEPARYELMHATRRTVVWVGDLEPGESAPIHTVGLDSPLLMLVNLGYCRTPSGEGALIHHGSNIMKHMSDQETRSNDFEMVTSRMKSETNADLENQKVTLADIASSTTVVDSIGQRLNLDIDNKHGAGGQRQITVSCPYWIVNTTEHSLQYKQEKSSHFVSGSIQSASKDGSKPVDLSKRNRFRKNGKHETIFPGRPGALCGARESLSMDEYTRLLGNEIPLEKVATLAFMFNFRESNPFGGYNRLSFQLVDPHWRSHRCSEWSRGFSPDSVGVTQIVGMHCLDGRQLEVAAIVTVAPGALSKYTKIVRICPRYVLVNQLSRPIRVWQDSSLVHPSRVLDATKDTTGSNSEHQNWRMNTSGKDGRKKGGSTHEDDLSLCQYDFLFGQPATLDHQPNTKMPPKTVAQKSAFYITTAGTHELPIPFHLPDTRADRELRVDLGSSWNLSASFPADIISDYTIKLTRVVDLRTLRHVDNRGAPRYKVKLPPTDTSELDMEHWDGELGIWFETIQWNGSTKCVVKGTKPGKFSYNNTDIHVGDELLAIDGNLVAMMEFADAMKLLKEKLDDVANTYKKKKARKNTMSGKKPKFLKRFDRTNSQEIYDTNRETVDEDTQSLRTLELEFQTLEFRMKKVRDRALRRQTKGNVRKKSGSENISFSDGSNNNNVPVQVASEVGNFQPPRIRNNEFHIQVSMKLLNQSVFVLINEKKDSAPYRVENRSLKHFIYFRQRTCENHPWNALSPGETMNYTWEEPLKTNKLLVKVGNQQQVSQAEKRGNYFLPFDLIDSEDQAGFGSTKTVKLNEVGFEGILPCPENGISREAQSLYCNIDTDGATRVLVVSDSNTMTNAENNFEFLEKHRHVLAEEINSEQSTLRRWLETKAILEATGTIETTVTRPTVSSQSLPTVQEDLEAIPTKEEKADDVDLDDIELESDNEETTIIRKHQLFVEVIEASGLQTANHSALTGLCSPYCSVRLEERTKKLRPNLFAKSVKGKKTYFIERCGNPKWSGMKFVFDVPGPAVSDPHGFALSVKVKDHRFVGRNRPLGRAEIHLRTLKGQKEVLGWFPLLLRSGRGSDLGNPAAAGRVQGSVKLRAQWIYTTPALIDYFILLSERYIVQLRANSESTRLYHEKMLSEEEKTRDLKEDSIFLPVKTRNTDGVLVSAMKKATKLKSIFKRPQHDKSCPEDQFDSLYDEMKEHNFQHSGTPHLQKIKTNLDCEGMGALFPSGMSSKNAALFDNNLNDQNFFPPNRGVAFSEGDLLRHILPPVQVNSVHLDYDPNGFDLQQDALDMLYLTNVLHNRRGEYFHHDHLDSSILSYGDVIKIADSYPSKLNSWVSAYDVVNNKELKCLLFPQSDARYNFLSIPKSPEKNLSRFEVIYPALSLPSRATSNMKEKNASFQKKLQSSRERFNKTAQRSLKAVLNPGGLLILRPITALCLPKPDKQDSYTGMVVRARYGSESCSTSTVEAKVTPTWTKESQVFVPRTENDLHVGVEPLKTSGIVKLSVVGTRLNSKVELGVLQIPLANAISCCTEATDNKLNGDVEGPGVYVRWFPLKDPKDCIEGDGQICYRPHESEKTSDDDFKTYMTPCIKIAMWWKQGALKDNKQKNTDLDTESPKRGAESIPRSLTDKYFHATIDAISASLIDSFRVRELLSLTMTDADLRYSHTQSTTHVALVIGRIQADQHSENALEPVILSPRPVANPKPTFMLLAIKNNIQSKSNLDAFKHIAISLEEMDFRIEEACMFDVWELFYHILRRHNATKESMLFAPSSASRIISHSNCLSFADYPKTSFLNEVIEMMNAVHDNAAGKKDQKVKQIYIEQLLLNSVKFNISYVKSPRRPDDVRDDLVTIYQGKYIPQISIGGKRRANEEFLSSSNYRRAETFKRWSELGLDDSWSMSLDERTKNFQNVISAAFPAITDAPVRVNGKFIDNIFEPWAEIIANLKHFYMKEMIFQVHKILGSVDFFGNPTMAVNSIMKGAHDFVVFPFREFLRSPNKLGIGVAKGTLSLLSNFFSGVFGFVSNISEAGGTAAAALSFDEHFQRWHKQQVADHFRHMHGALRPQGCDLVLSAVARPLQDIVAGLFFAASGVLVEPYKGAQLKGMAGFSKGVGIGTVGLVAKPLVGVFDAFAHVSESIHDVARSANVLEKKPSSVKRLRLAYVFGLHKTLLPYNSVDACSANLLRLFPLKDGKRSQTEERECLILSQLLQKGPGLGCYLVVTTRRVLKFCVKYNASLHPIMEWEVKMSGDVQITSNVEHITHDKVVLQILSVPKRSLLSLVKKDNRKSFEKSEHDRLRRTLEVPQPNASLDSKYRKSLKQNPVQHALGAFASNKIKKKERVEHYVPGDLTTERDALIQIHNAICCLTGQFGSVLPRKFGSSGGGKSDVEGLTSFGPLHFGEEYENVTAQENDVSDFLELIPWVHFGDIHKMKGRTEWTFQDELQSTKAVDDSPSWIVDARARSTFVALPFPIIPSTQIQDQEEVQRLSKELMLGTKSLKEVEEELNLYHHLDQKGDTIRSRNSDSIEEFGEGGLTFDAEEEPSRIDATNVTVEDRLEHVECMLQRLLASQPSVAPNGVTSNPVFPPSNVSAVSALTGSGDHFLEMGTTTNPSSNETEQLRQEVHILRRQLAQRDMKAPWQGDDLSSGADDIANGQKKKRKLKKFWKA